MRGSVLISTLVVQGSALACSLETYSYYDPKAADRGFVPGKSPATPEVVEAYVYYGGCQEQSGGCPLGPQAHDSCEGVEFSYLVLRLRSADEATRFKLDWGEAGGPSPVDHAIPYAVEGQEVVVRAELRAEPPFTLEVTAYDAEAYASEPVRVDVDRVVDERPDEGCAISRSRGAARWLLALAMALAGRLYYRRSKGPPPRRDR